MVDDQVPPKAVAFCRCRNVPARYCTAYLGEFGLPATDTSMHFSAWFEARLGREWDTFDPRNNVPRMGRVLIVRGRDAADVIIATTVGPNALARFTVYTDANLLTAASVSDWLLSTQLFVLCGVSRLRGKKTRSHRKA